MKYKLEAINKDEEDYLKDIRSYFKSSSNSIHKARNELKVIDGKVIKSFKKPSFLKSIIYSLTPSKAKRSYLYSLRLKEFSPKPLGYIEFYESGLLRDSYFVSQEFKYDFTIREVLLDFSFNDRENILKEFARFTYNLHEENILHLDFSPGNILIKKCLGGYIFKVVDLNRMTFKNLSLIDRLKNFNKLWASDDDIKIIVSEYADIINYDKKEAIRLAQNFNNQNKAIKNFKKRLKGIPVID